MWWKAVALVNMNDDYAMKASLTFRCAISFRAVEVLHVAPQTFLAVVFVYSTSDTIYNRCSEALSRVRFSWVHSDERGRVLRAWTARNKTPQSTAFKYSMVHARQTTNL